MQLEVEEEWRPMTPVLHHKHLQRHSLILHLPAILNEIKEEQKEGKKKAVLLEVLTQQAVVLEILVEKEKGAAVHSL
jgi:hypothetical protein